MVASMICRRGARRASQRQLAAQGMINEVSKTIGGRTVHTL